MQTVGSLVPASLLALFAVHPPDNVQDGMFLLTVCFGALGAFIYFFFNNFIYDMIYLF